MQKVGLKLKITKCEFLKPIVSLLEHRVDKDEVHVDEEKIKAIKEVPEPKHST